MAFWKSMSDEHAWTWRVADAGATRELELLYEPGNWGDVLKGVWAVSAALAVADELGGRELAFVDPFAGAPSWPLVPSAARRVAELPPSGWLAAQRPWIAAGRLASTGRAVLGSLPASCPARALVFDIQPERCDRWRNAAEPPRTGEPEPGPPLDPSLALEVADAARGEEVLLEHARSADLLLVDPFDLFERFEELLPLALGAGGHGTTLLYLYNKASRSVAMWKRYGELRRRIGSLLATDPARREVLVGRIPSDPILPRAWHEVLLVAPPSQVARLRHGLRESTAALARLVIEPGVFEEALVREESAVTTPEWAQLAGRPEPAPTGGPHERAGRNGGPGPQRLHEDATP